MSDFKYRCPLCIANSDPGDPRHDPAYDYKYSLEELDQHLDQKHKTSEMIDYILEDAQDVDLNYRKKVNT